MLTDALTERSSFGDTTIEYDIKILGEKLVFTTPIPSSAFHMPNVTPDEIRKELDRIMTPYMRGLNFIIRAGADGRLRPYGSLWL